MNEWFVYGMLAALVEIDDDGMVWVQEMVADATEARAIHHFIDGEDAMLTELAKHYPAERAWLEALV